MEGQPKIFTCNISQHSSFSRLEWRINFQDEISVPSITEQFTSVDREGQVFEEDRNEINFQFNLTSNDGQILLSVLKITLPDDNGTAVNSVINNATVSCGSGEEPDQQALLHAILGMVVLNRRWL